MDPCSRAQSWAPASTSHCQLPPHPRPQPRGAQGQWHVDSAGEGRGKGKDSEARQTEHRSRRSGFVGRRRVPQPHPGLRSRGSETHLLLGINGELCVPRAAAGTWQTALLPTRPLTLWREGVRVTGSQPVSGGTRGHREGVRPPRSSLPVCRGEARSAPYRTPLGPACPGPPHRPRSSRGIPLCWGQPGRPGL